MKILHTVCVLIFFSISIHAQKLVSFEYLSTQKAIGLNIIVPGLKATYDVDLYSVQYNTIDAVGIEHVASGLICIPQITTESVFPMACYQHGTVDGRNDVPSMQRGGFLLPTAFAAYGYVVCAPDFVGLGSSPGIHPYVHAASEASAGVDMILATQEIIAQIDQVSLNDQLFISGYSQGGHAAMALHREMELNQSDIYTVTASAPMSGPYSISGKMKEFTLSDEEYGTVSYLAWLILGYKTAYPDELAALELEDIFKPEYIADIREFENETIGLTELNDRMTETLLSTVGTVTPKNTVFPNIVDALFNDPTHPLSVALKDNDTYDWAPSSPTQLYYCEGDEQVTYENAILAEEVMTANGSTSVKAIRKDRDNLLLSHGGCIVPSSLDAIAWFDTFKEVSSVNNFDQDPGIAITFSENILRVDMALAAIESGQMLIFDMSGKELSQSMVSKGVSEYQLYDLHAGFYIVAILDAGRLVYSTKLIKS